MKNSPRQHRRTEAQIRLLLNQYNKRPINVTEFCKAHNIHKATFYNWRNKFGVGAEKPVEFIPVQLNHVESEPGLFVEIELNSKAIVRLYQKVEVSYLKALLK